MPVSCLILRWGLCPEGEDGEQSNAACSPVRYRIFLIFLLPRRGDEYGEDKAASLLNPAPSPSPLLSSESISSGHSSMLVWGVSKAVLSSLLRDEICECLLGDGRGGVGGNGLVLYFSTR